MGVLIVCYVIAHFLMLSLESKKAHTSSWRKLGPISHFIFDRVRERIQHQFGYMAVGHGIEPMLSITPARHQSSIAETPEPFRNR